MDKIILTLACIGVIWFCTELISYVRNMNKVSHSEYYDYCKNEKEDSDE